MTQKIAVLPGDGIGTEIVAEALKVLDVLKSDFGLKIETEEALIGGVAGVFAAGGVLSLASIVGFITLFGIATRNGIMLISHIHHLRGEGVHDFRTLVIRGASERIAPILMTATAAGLALVPIALGMGKPGSEIQAPMAIVIFFGLISSTFLNMIVVPAAYYRLRAPRAASVVEYESPVSV